MKTLAFVIGLNFSIIASSAIAQSENCKVVNQAVVNISAAGDGAELKLCGRGIVGGLSTGGFSKQFLLNFLQAQATNTELILALANSGIGANYEEQMRNILAIRDGEMNIIEMHNDDGVKLSELDVNGLKLIAQAFNTWSGAEAEIKDDELSAYEKSQSEKAEDAQMIPLDASQLQRITDANAKLRDEIRNTDVCSLKYRELTVYQVNFEDHDNRLLMPWKLIPVPGKPNEFDVELQISGKSFGGLIIGDQAGIRRLKFVGNDIFWISPNGIESPVKITAYNPTRALGEVRPFGWNSNDACMYKQNLESSEIRMNSPVPPKASAQ